MIRNVSVLICCVLLVVGCEKKGEADRKEALMNSKSSSLIDGVLNISKDYFTAEQIQKSRQFVDTLAADIKSKIQPNMEPKNVLQIINNKIFADLGMKYEKSMDNIEYSLLPSVTSKKRGNCLGLTTLYLVIGEKLGFPLFASTVPDHLFVMYVNGNDRINIETADSGNIHSNQEYLEKFPFPSKLIGNVYLKSLNIDESISLIKSNLATAFMKKGEYDKSIKLNTSALTNLGNNPDIRSNLAVAYINSGQPLKAIDHLNLAISVYPENIHYHLNLAQAFVDTKQEDQAVKEYEKAMAIDPDLKGIGDNDKGDVAERIARVCHNAGNRYFKNKDYDRALDAWKTFLILHNDDADTHNNVAIVLYVKGNYEEAMTHAKLTAKYGKPVDREIIEAIQHKLNR